MTYLSTSNIFFIYLSSGKVKWKDELKSCGLTTMILLMGLAFIIFLVPHMVQVAMRWAKFFRFLQLSIVQKYSVFIMSESIVRTQETIYLQANLRRPEEPEHTCHPWTCPRCSYTERTSWPWNIIWFLGQCLNSLKVLHTHIIITWRNHQNLSTMASTNK